MSARGRGGWEPPHYDPLIQGLLKLMPPLGNSWPREGRDLWLQTWRNAIALLYPDAESAVLESDAKVLASG